MALHVKYLFFYFLLLQWVQNIKNIALFHQLLCEIHKFRKKTLTRSIYEISLTGTS
jgi:hypothetical protein